MPNRRYRYLLDHGVTGLSVAFDLPTQIGYDSDHAMATGEVGKVGVAIDSLQDMEILFDGIPLDQVTTSMTINATASILLAMYIVVAEERGIARDDAQRRIAAQASDAERRALATHVIDNSGDLSHLEAQIETLWANLRRRKAELGTQAT